MSRSRQEWYDWGARCTEEGGSEFGYIITKPLTQPDLTKLREVLDKYAPNIDDPDVPTTSWFTVYCKFYYAVKELLEQEEK